MKRTATCTNLFDLDLQLWVLNKLIIYISWTSINTVYQCNFVTYVHEILKGVGAGQAVVVGDEDVVQLDVAVLDDPQRDTLFSILLIFRPGLSPWTMNLQTMFGPVNRNI